MIASTTVTKHNPINTRVVGPSSSLTAPPVYLAPSSQAIRITQVTQGLTGAPGAGDGTVTPAAPTSPVFAWSGGVLVGVTYADGSTKSLTWGAERLERIDFERPALPGVRKDFSYNVDGTLAAVAQTAF